MFSETDKGGHWMYQEYPMPAGPVWVALAKRHIELKRDERYVYARSCKYCVEYGDSFNRWTNTDCTRHVLSERIRLADMEVDRLSICKTCEFYEGRS